MGTIMHPVVAPADARKISAASFSQLVMTLFGRGRAEDDDRDSWFETPFAVFAGKAAEKLAVWDLGPDRVPKGAVWFGEDLDKLEAALKKAIAKRADIAVWFYAVADTPRELRGIGGDGFVRGALRWRPTAKLLKISNAYGESGGELPSVKANAWFELDGKAAPFAEDVVKTPLGDELVKVFGKKPFAETSMS